MKAEYVNHKNESRIRLDFTYNTVLIDKVKAIPGALWSHTMHAWHVPDKEETKIKLTQLFPEIKFIYKKDALLQPIQINKNNYAAEDILTKENQCVISEDKHQQASNKNYQVGICITNEFIYLKLKKDVTDISFLRTLHFHRWDKTMFLWIITNSKLNRDLIYKYFDTRLVPMPRPQLVTREKTEKPINKIANTLYIIEYTEGRVRLLFDFNDKFVHFVKTIAFNKWDAINKWWSIPYSPSIHKNIELLCSELGWKIEIVKQKETEIKKSRTTRDKIINYRTCPAEMVDKLTMLRYSPKTAKSYISAFEEFINFHNTKDC